MQSDAFKAALQPAKQVKPGEADAQSICGVAHPCQQCQMHPGQALVRHWSVNCRLTATQDVPAASGICD